MINLFQNAMTTFSTKNTSSTGRGIFQGYDKKGSKILYTSESFIINRTQLKFNSH